MRKINRIIIPIVDNECLSFGTHANTLTLKGGEGGGGGGGEGGGGGRKNKKERNSETE